MRRGMFSKPNPRLWASKMFPKTLSPGALGLKFGCGVWNASSFSGMGFESKLFALPQLQMHVCLFRR